MHLWQSDQFDHGWCQIAQLVLEHLAIDLGGLQGLNPGLVCHYFSHPIGFGALTNPWS